MKKFNFLIFLILIFFSFFIDVNATNEKKYISDDGDYYFILNKDNYEVKGEYNVYQVSDYKLKPFYGFSFEKDIILKVYTHKDEVLDSEKWWHGFYACTAIDWNIAGIGGTVDFNAYSSPFESGFDNTGFLWSIWSQIIGGKEYSCDYYYVQDVTSENTVYNSCIGYNNIFKKIMEYANDYSMDKSISYITQYNTKLEELKTYCSTVYSNANYDDPCLTRCMGLTNDKENWDVMFDISTASDNGACGISNRLISWIFNIVKWLKYIIPVIVIVLGILDFIKAIASEKDDEMKKAQGRFIKRLIAAALIFLVPFIIEFILDKMGFEVTGCGIIKELQ